MSNSRHEVEPPRHGMTLRSARTPVVVRPSAQMASPVPSSASSEVSRIGGFHRGTPVVVTATSMPRPPPPSAAGMAQPQSSPQIWENVGTVRPGNGEATRSEVDGLQLLRAACDATEQNTRTAGALEAAINQLAVLLPELMLCQRQFLEQWTRVGGSTAYRTTLLSDEDDTESDAREGASGHRVPTTTLTDGQHRRVSRCFLKKLEPAAAFAQIQDWLADVLPLVVHDPRIGKVPFLMSIVSQRAQDAFRYLYGPRELAKVQVLHTLAVGVTIRMGEVFPDRFFLRTRDGIHGTAPMSLCSLKFTDIRTDFVPSNGHPHGGECDDEDCVDVQPSQEVTLRSFDEVCSVFLILFAGEVDTIMHDANSAVALLLEKYAADCDDIDHADGSETAFQLFERLYDDIIYRMRMSFLRLGYSHDASAGSQRILSEQWIRILNHIASRPDTQGGEYDAFHRFVYTRIQRDGASRRVYSQVSNLEELLRAALHELRRRRDESRFAPSRGIDGFWGTQDVGIIGNDRLMAGFRTHTPRPTVSAPQQKASDTSGIATVKIVPLPSTPLTLPAKLRDAGYNMQYICADCGMRGWSKSTVRLGREKKGKCLNCPCNAEHASAIGYIPHKSEDEAYSMVVY